MAPTTIVVPQSTTPVAYMTHWHGQPGTALRDSDEGYWFLEDAGSIHMLTDCEGLDLLEEEVETTEHLDRITEALGLQAAVEGF